MNEVVITGAGNDTPAPVLTEAVADAAVDVARIEAERDVSIAEIHAETAETAIEAQQEADVEWLRQQLQSLRDACETNTATSSALAETQALMLGRLEAMETTLAARTAPIVTEADLIQPLSSETETEADSGADQDAQGEASQEAEAALEHDAEAPATRKRRGYLR